MRLNSRLFNHESGRWPAIHSSSATNAWYTPRIIGARSTVNTIFITKPYHT